MSFEGIEGREKGMVMGFSLVFMRWKEKAGIMNGMIRFLGGENQPLAVGPSLA